MNSNLAYQESPIEELIDGKVVLMSPRPSMNHNFVAGNIFNIFFNYLNGKSCCVPIGDGSDLYLTDKDRFVPDCMIVCDKNKIKHDGVHGAPDLVVEVLSPGTAKYDRGHKSNIYAKCGVREYWIVNPSDKAVEIYLINGDQFILHDIYSIYPDYLLAKMTVEEQAVLVTEFKCSLFDDLIIKLEDIFKRTF